MTRRTAKIAQATAPGAPLAVRAPAQEEYTAVVMASTSSVAPRRLLATAVRTATRSVRPRCAREGSRARVRAAAQAAFRLCLLSSCLTTCRTLRCAAAVRGSSSRRVELACRGAGGRALALASQRIRPRSRTTARHYWRRRGGRRTSARDRSFTASVGICRSSAIACPRIEVTNLGRILHRDQAGEAGVLAQTSRRSTAACPGHAETWTSYGLLCATVRQSDSSH